MGHCFKAYSNHFEISRKYMTTHVFTYIHHWHSFSVEKYCCTYNVKGFTCEIHTFTHTVLKVIKIKNKNKFLYSRLATTKWSNKTKTITIHCIDNTKVKLEFNQRFHMKLILLLLEKCVEINYECKDINKTLFYLFCYLIQFDKIFATFYLKDWYLRVSRPKK